MYQVNDLRGKVTMEKNTKNLYWHEHSVSLKQRWESYDHKSCVLWFTGLSASGKSTMANLVCKELHERGVKSYILDGDNIRHGLNRDLGFGPVDRKENIRRIGEVAKLFVDSGLIVMTAFISPYREDREVARRLFKSGEFIEIFTRCPVAECERRDPKGIYKRARAGEVREFTGISAPYEEPEHPELVLCTAESSSERCLSAVMTYLEERDMIPRKRTP